MTLREKTGVKEKKNGVQTKRGRGKLSGDLRMVITQQRGKKGCVRRDKD